MRESAVVIWMTGIGANQTGCVVVPAAKPRRLRVGSRNHPQPSCAVFSQPTGVRSLACGTAPARVQAKRDLIGLLHRDLLSPRAHERGGPRVACVALERIAPEKGPSATEADSLLGDRDDRAMHGDPLSSWAALINMIAMISE